MSPTEKSSVTDVKKFYQPPPEPFETIFVQADVAWKDLMASIKTPDHKRKPAWASLSYLSIEHFIEKLFNDPQLVARCMQYFYQKISAESPKHPERLL